MHHSLAEAKARTAARRVLHDSWVQRPDHIELDLLAWRSGLVITMGGLESAEGRLVASDAGGGFIRVRDGIASAGRQRFAIAHEIGHFHLHKKQTYTDTARELATYQANDLETEANLFAAELLMPDFLFLDAIRGREPSHAMLQSLAGTFATSHLATGIQYLTYTIEPCALVFVRHGIVQWTRTSDTWEWPLLENESEVHPHSGAGEYHASIAAASRDREASDAGRDRVGPQPGPIATPAEAWLPRSRSCRGATLREDTLVWPEQRVTVSLLWADEELD